MSRRNEFDKTDAVSLFVLAATCLVTAAIYEKLPARIPTHFDLHGHANGWSSRAFGVCLLPVITLLSWAVVRFGGAFAGPVFRERLAASPVRMVGLVLVGFMSALHLVMVWSALHGGASIGIALGIVLGIFWIVLAQILPRVRRNPFIGVRTAWTLSSDENWARTHRFAGWTFTLGGLAALAAALVGLPTVAMTAIVLSALVPVAYSWAMRSRV